MAIIIKLQGLPLEATSIDVRRYFLGLKIPDGGVHIVGGVDGTVFIEFASDEDARQAMARGDGSIKNSSIKLLLSSGAEMQTVVEAARAQQQQYLKQQQQHHQQQTQQQHHQQQPQQQLLHQHQQQSSPFIDPRILSQNYQSMIPSLSQPAPQPFLPPTQVFNQFPPTTIATSNAALGLNLLGNVGLGGNLNALPPSLGLSPAVTGTVWPEAAGGPMGPASIGNNGNLPIRPTGSRNSPDNRSRMSSMRGGDDKLFANKRCVLAASNIPYRATSKDIIEFLSEFNIKEDCIRRRYNQKGQPTADAKIAFATPDAAMKALKMMNKKTLCGRPVFLKPV